MKGRTLILAATTLALGSASALPSPRFGALVFALRSKKNLLTAQGGAKTEKFKPSLYVQFQWQDTESEFGSSPRNDGFQLRRVRIGGTYTHNEKISAKVSFDAAAGSNRLGAELKDGFVNYRPGKATTLQIGQQSLPLGYEIERSSSVREMPERALYNRRLFSGERDRGMFGKHEIGNGWDVSAGVWNGLTVSDPQMEGFRDSDNKIAFTVGLRNEASDHDFGISALFGHRPGFVGGNGTIVSAADRALVYLHGAYSGWMAGRVEARAEAAFGRDRDPLGGLSEPKFTKAADVLGWQAQVSYTINPVDILVFRFDSYDPDTSSGDDRTDTWGLGFIHWLDRSFKVTLSFESPKNQGSDKRDNVWTLRGQFKL